MTSTLQIKDKPQEKVKKNISIIIRLENCICEFDKCVIKAFDKAHNPKKPKDYQKLKKSNIKENYSSTEKEALNDIINSEDFWKDLEVVPNVLLALEHMRENNYDLKILISNIDYNNISSLNERVKWIKKILKHHYWLERIIFCNDKTILECDFLIDADGKPETSGKNIPRWKHILFDAPYNKDLTDKTRIMDWKNWKLQIEQGEHNNRIFYIHGSPDSNDIDKFYLFDEMPSNNDSYNFCHGVKEEDRNIIVVKNGVIINAHKGNRDECNNSLLDTYNLHKQIYPNPVKRKIARIVPLKFTQFVLKTLKLLGDEKELKADIRLALKKESPFEKRFKLFKEIDIEKTHLNVDQLKSLAFQYCLVLGLIEGVEIYTKMDAAKYIPDLQPFVYRKETKDLGIFTKLKNKLLDYVKGISLIQEGLFLTVRYNQNIDDSKVNFLQVQSNGMVINAQTESLVYYPFDHPNIFKPTWMNEKQEYYHPEIKDIYDVVSFDIVESETIYFGNPQKIEVLKKMKIDLNYIHTDQFYYIFDIIKDELYLIGLRSKITYDLESNHVVIENAKKLNIKYFEK